MWGYEPSDNDRAADWFAKTIDDSGFADRVRETLQKVIDLDYIDDEVTVVRAACYCLIKFGHVYVWPINDLKSDIKLGITALEKVLEEEEDEKIIALINIEIKELQDRLLTIK
jgi:hypothetical protein